MPTELPKAGTALTLTHALCGSATPVPAELPSDGKPVQVKPSDFGGDATNGWRCLRFEAPDPRVRFRYTYVRGGPYKAPARGGPDPGPNGFEACAETDFNPGGDTTLVCMSGAIDKATDSIKVEINPFEVFED